MSDRLLFDTDILIDYLRGRSEAKEYLESLTEQAFLISSITVAELFAGIRNDKEKNQLEIFVSSFEILPITKEIAERGGLICNAFSRSHGTGLGDALIAATAEIHNASIVTFNKKHFPMLQDVVTPFQK